MTPEKMRARKLSDERFLLAQRRGHPGGAGPATLDEFCSLRFVLMAPTGGAFAGGVDETLATIGRSRRVMASTTQFTLIGSLLHKTDYVSVLPERLAHAPEQALKVTELPFETRGFSLHIAWHPRLQGDASHRWLRDKLAAL